LEALEEAVTDSVAAYLRACGGAVDRDPALAARMVVQVVETVTHELALRPRGVAVDAYVDEAVVLLTRYLGPRDNGVPSAPREA
jgi:Tetracyclin repressor-like, C-terminal domain